MNFTEETLDPKNWEPTRKLAHKIIDTLPLSLLLFNEKSIHALPKNYKSEDDFKNDPVEDCKITAQLLTKLEERFLSLEEATQNAFYSLH